MIPGVKCREYIFHYKKNICKKNIRIWYFRGANPLSNYPFFTDLQPPQKRIIGAKMS